MNRNQQYSVRDAMFYAVMTGCGEAYLSAYAIHLEATSTQVGLLAALPPFIGALFQIWSVKALDKVSDRQRLMITGALAQTGSWILIALLGIFFDYGTATVFSLIGFTIIYYGSGGFITPIWSSLIGDLVPEATRGKFFGYRNKQAGIITFLSITLAGVVLELCSEHAVSTLGFTFIFVVAAIARVCSIYWLSRHDNPHYYAPPEASFTFIEFIKQLFTSNFAKFSLYVSLMNLAVFIAGPYFTIYLLRELKLSYVAFTAIAAGSTVAQFVTIQQWGSLVDRYGSKRMLAISSWGLSIVPLLWLLSDNFWFLMAVQFYAGAIWGGFQLTIVTFLFDAVSRVKRARCAAYQGILGSFGMLVGSLVGALGLEVTQRMIATGDFVGPTKNSLLILFLASGILRCATSFFFLKRFKEVREVSSSIRKDLSFRLAQLRPFAGSSFQIIPRSKNGEKKPKE